MNSPEARSGERVEVSPVAVGLEPAGVATVPPRPKAANKVAGFMSK